jgi:tRNA(Phe) wybutosine-synthesizing methylase Tyw3
MFGWVARCFSPLHEPLGQLSKTRFANEKQTAALRKSNEELRKHNERLAELASKIEGSFSKQGIYSAPLPKLKQP